MCVCVCVCVRVCALTCVGVCIPYVYAVILDKCKFYGICGDFTVCEIFILEFFLYQAAFHISIMGKMQVGLKIELQTPLQITIQKNLYHMKIIPYT